MKEIADLILHVKKEYFDLIKSGEKTEEYREIKPYWSVRINHRIRNVIVLCGYPNLEKEPEKVLVFPWKGYEEKTIRHKQFGQDWVDVFAIKLVNRIEFVRVRK